MFWILLAIEPVDRETWVLENIIVAIGILVLFVTARYYIFSRTSYFLIFCFLCLHAIGSHYTYSAVPYDSAFEKLTGRSFNELLGWKRNHYDRLIHFLYGLLILFPFRETFLHFARVRWAFWSYLVPFSLILATSLVYEMLEWAAAEIFGGDLGAAFVGTQGDEWDAQKDSFFATTGALIATAVIAAKHAVTGRDSARDWVERSRTG